MNPSASRKKAWGDLVSSINISLGGLSIMYVLDGSLHTYHIASMLFFFILVMDGIDGALARRTRQSPMGAYLDSVSDGIGFVLLPCMLLYSIHYVRGLSGLFYFPNAIIVLSIIIYTSAGFFRLARFTVLPPSEVFRGAPVSLPAIMVVSMLGMGLPMVPVALVLLISTPMLLSQVPFPKVKRMMLAPAALAIISGMAAFFLVVVSHGEMTSLSRWLLLMPLGLGCLYSISPVALLYKSRVRLMRRAKSP